MEIISAFTQSKTGDESTSEDGIFCNYTFSAVIDGATSHSEKSYDGRTPGQTARDILIEALETLSPTVDAQKAAIQLDKAITDFYKRQNISDFMQQHPVDRCQASLVIFSKTRREIWMIGDCQAMIGTEIVTNGKYIDQLMTSVRSYVLESEIASGKTVNELIVHDAGRAAVVPLIKKQYIFQNSDHPVYGHDVLNGFFQKKHKVKVIKIPAKVKEIVLATDGYPSLYSSLDETEAALAKVLKEDPLCFRQNKQVKAVCDGMVSYDDRTYLKLKV